jgi:ArsR family transcriptional regulator, arsenate/arsenite/antimonite-responsive transcriptional repressor
MRAPTSQTDNLVQQLKALADPKRIRIMNLLMEGVQCNCELGDELGMSKNLISHHLRILREAELVEVERDVYDARWIYYSLNRKTLSGLVENFNSFFDPNRIQSRQPQCGPRMRSATTDTAFVT